MRELRAQVRLVLQPLHSSRTKEPCLVRPLQCRGTLCAVYSEQAEALKSRKKIAQTEHRSVILMISYWPATKTFCGTLGYPGKHLILFFENMDLTCITSVL